MNPKFSSKTFYKGFFCILLLIAIAFTINSCKKNTSTVPIADDKVLQAKAWYENNFPNVTNGKNNKLITQTVGDVSTTNFDYTQFIAPYWDNSVSYTRYNKNVVEVPIEPSASFATSLSNMPNSGAVYKKEYSRTSFLIISEGQKTAAYIMTVIADSSYVQNDISKLDRNKYNKRDADFSGVVLYHTPNGKFIKGWFYKNGNITFSISPQNGNNTTSVNGQKQQIQSLKTNTITQNCYFWYQTVYAYGSVTTTCLDFYCITIDDGAGGGGYGGDGTGGDTGSGVGGGDNTGGNGGGGTGGPRDVGFPPVEDNPVTVVLNITMDTLTLHFPCATKLIINGLAAVRGYYEFTAPFTSASKPDLVWTDKGLDWNPNGGLTTLGVTKVIPKTGGFSSKITLNDSLLRNGSQLMIAATAIHETLHGYLNYNYAAGVPQTPTIGGSWMNDLDLYFNINSLPQNYSDHLTMMKDYFFKSVDILSKFDNNQHTPAQYAMAMLYGLNNPGTGSTQTEKDRLATLYLFIELHYGFSDSDLNNFVRGELKATTNKLPTSGC